MQLRLLAGACLCALFTVAAHAQQPPPRPLVGGHGNDVAVFVAQHDGNADARLTWEEFHAFRRNRYDTTDANRDRTVDVAEYVQEFEDRLRRQAEQGRPAQIEQTRRRFAALDADKNGQVSRAEFDASGERVWNEGRKAPASGDEGGKDGDGMSDASAARRGRTSDRFALPSSHTVEGFRELFDGNGDGDVTRGEFDQARSAQFVRTDTNRDGALNDEEYLAEFEDRLDRHVALTISGSDRQTHTRYGSLDADKDGKMTFAEFQVSGKRTFDAADRNHDGIVDGEDAKLPPPPRPERAADDGRAASAN